MLPIALMPEVDVNSATRATAVPEDSAAGSVDGEPVTVDLDSNGNLPAR